MNNDVIFADERLDKVNEDITLIQKKNGLTFGSDAFLLASYMKAQKNALAVELGAGTGIISLLAASKKKFASIRMYEIQPEFAELCERNIALNGLGGMLHVKCADIRDRSQIKLPKEADVVFANPPYMTSGSGRANQFEAKYIARHEICGAIDDFCSAASSLLRFGGRFYCVWRPDRLTALFSALSAHALEAKLMTFVCADRETAPSMVLVCAQKGASPSLKLTPPLILHETDSRNDRSRALTQSAKQIYDTMSFEDFFAQSR